MTSLSYCTQKQLHKPVISPPRDIRVVGRSTGRINFHLSMPILLFHNCKERNKLWYILTFYLNNKLQTAIF